MSLLNKPTAGFTLIEVTLVLAIAALLGTAVMFGQRQIRQRAQFSDAIERVKNAMVQAKNEANTTVSAGAGSNPNQVIFGKRVRFGNRSGVADPSYITVDTLRLQLSSNTVSLDTTAGNAYTIKIPWGVTFKSPALANDGREIVFIRNKDSGRLEVYTPRHTVAFNDLVYSTYNGTNQNSTDYRLVDLANNYTAYLNVTGSTGTIKRVIN